MFVKNRTDYVLTYWPQEGHSCLTGMSACKKSLRRSRHDHSAAYPTVPPGHGGRQDGQMMVED
jgi:hypothetical protein